MTEGRKGISNGLLSCCSHPGEGERGIATVGRLAMVPLDIMMTTGPWRYAGLESSAITRHA